MNEGEKSAVWVTVCLLMVGTAAYFTIFMIIFNFVKQLFWS